MFRINNLLNEWVWKQLNALNRCCWYLRVWLKRELCFRVAKENSTGAYGWYIQRYRYQSGSERLWRPMCSRGLQLTLPTLFLTFLLTDTMNKGHRFLDPHIHPKILPLPCFGLTCLAAHPASPPIVQPISLANLLNIFKRPVSIGGER